MRVKIMKEQEFPELKPPTLARSKSGRGVRSSRGSKNRTHENEERTHRAGIAETYEVPQTRSQAAFVKPPHIRTSEYESIEITGITPV